VQSAESGMNHTEREREKGGGGGGCKEKIN